MERYIGLDAHATSCTFGVISERGKHLKSAVVETNGQALVEFLKTVPGRKHLCLEEGTQSTWLYEILAPHVQEIVVTHLSRETPGRKDDETDAFARAEDLRIGSVTPVYKPSSRMGQLRAQVDVHLRLTGDLVRTKNRLKALYRSRGVATVGPQVYTLKHRDDYQGKLPKDYQPAALLMYAQLDAVHRIRLDAEKQLIAVSHTHAISKVLETCPGIGPIRAAQLIATIVTPQRFRGARQLWSYCGLGIVMRSSSDWTKTAAGWQRVEVRQTRGLNRNHNRRMKTVFKGAATTVISNPPQPMYGSYLRLLEQGTKPPLAKLTLARRIAATMLSMWKSKETYDPDAHPRKR